MHITVKKIGLEIKIHFDNDNKTERIPIPKEVISHFQKIRNIRDIIRLGEKTGKEIEIVDWEFSQSNRINYHNNLCELIRRKNKRKIVFLDPDTGLAPKNVKEEHVKNNEISDIWLSLNKGDFLVFYQHRPHEKDWKENRNNQLAAACQIEKSLIKQWEAPKIASDVALFFSEK